MGKIISPVGMQGGAGGNGWGLNLANTYNATGGDVLDVGVNDFSGSVWIKTTTTAFDSVIGKRDGGAAGTVPGWVLRTRSDGKIEFFIDDGDSSENIVSAALVNDGLLHHVAFTADRDGNGILYVDGIENGTPESIATEADTLNNGVDFGLGRNVNNISGLFDGFVYDAKLLTNGIWTPTQILYQKNNPYDIGAPAGTISDAWACNEGTGATLSGKVNDLTLSNVAAWKYGRIPR